MLLDSTIEVLPATSPVTIKRLKSLGISTYLDLINYFPFRYEDYSFINTIRSLREGELTTIKGIITDSKNTFTQRGFRLQKITIHDNSGSITLTWINQPYLVHILKEGLTLAVSGEVVRFAGKLTLQPNEWEIVKNDTLVHTGRIMPIYSETYGLSSKTIREKMFHVISHLKNTKEPKEVLPEQILSFNSLIPLQKAYLQIHFPSSKSELMQARARLGFDELLALQLVSQYTKRQWQARKVNHLFKEDKILKGKAESFIKTLPFTLTDDQLKVVREIQLDLHKTAPMNRFLQGDVGSGKTVVAAIAAYITYLNGLKTVFMAPTEILAIQHYQTIQSLFKKTGLKIAILTSSQKTITLKDNDFDIVIGTQALLNTALELKRVGLIVIDEQHRFGVAQRSLLKEKGGEPHLLTMTATPIPRTLALTIYGELDLSVIETMPKGRIPIKTFLVPPLKRSAAYVWIKNKILSEHTQVFIICPRIEESQSETTKSVRAAKKEYESLKNNEFKGLRIDLLHGKLKPSEKNSVMESFAKGELDVLVSTSVVEVGIDIPNASIMLIEGADRYGLAQLHQLRGRVGRGKAQSYCYLFSDTQDEAVINRLSFFARTNKGADLAAYDLKSRGSGNIFGTTQHGYMKLKIASLSNLSLIEQTKNTALYILDTYTEQNFPVLKKALETIDKEKTTNN